MLCCDELKDFGRPGAAGYSFPKKQTPKNKRSTPPRKRQDKKTRGRARQVSVRDDIFDRGHVEGKLKKDSGVKNFLKKKNIYIYI